MLMIEKGEERAEDPMKIKKQKSVNLSIIKRSWLLLRPYCLGKTQECHYGFVINWSSGSKRLYKQ